MARQLSLFSRQAPGFDPGFTTARRLALGDGAWVELAPGWLRGDDVLLDILRDQVAWHAGERVMYDQMVAVPRLTGAVSEAAWPPVIGDAASALSARYGVTLDRVTLAYYRDGHDSVAWHGDKIRHVLDEAVVAIVSLGYRRRFLMRPVSGGSSRRFAVGAGDLLVMGGTSQRTWQHCVPKVADAGPRISIMFRHGAEED